MLDEQDLITRMRRGEQRAFDQFSMPTPPASAHSPRDAAARRRRNRGRGSNDDDQRNARPGRFPRRLFAVHVAVPDLPQSPRGCPAQAARQPAMKSLEEFGGESCWPRSCSSPTFAIRSMSARPMTTAARCAAPSTACRRITRGFSNCASATSSRSRDRARIGVTESAAESQLVRARHAFRDQWLNANGGAADVSAAPNSGERR